MRPLARTLLAVLVPLASLPMSNCSCGGEPVAAVTVVLRVAPSAVDFGHVPIGAAVHRTVAIANSGNGAWAGEPAPSIEGPGFALTAPCAVPLAPNTFCNVDIAFTPLTEGPQAASFVVAGPDGDLVVALQGQGDPAQIVVDPATLDFGSLNVGETSTRTITVENRGDADVNAPLVLIGPGFFTDAGARTALSIAAGATIAVDVAFSPSQGGAAAGRAVIEVCGPGCGPEVALRGVGTAPRIDVAPRTVDFGEVAQGAQAAVDLVVTNGGAGDLALSAVNLLSGTADVKLDDVALPLVIPEGGSATLTLAYAPTAARGALDATLRIRSNDPVSSDVTVPIDGTSAGPALQLLPHAGNFGVLDLGVERTLDAVVRSTGTVPATVTQVRIEGASFGFVAAAPPTGELLPGESLLFTVLASATPSDVAAGGGHGRVVISAAGMPDAVLPLEFLSGTAGCQPRAQVPNAALGAVVLGQGTTGSAFITNVGDAPCVLSDANPAPGFPFDTGFSFSVTGARTIAPGGLGHVDFSFHPFDAAQHSAFLDVTFTDAAAPLLLSATARGVTGALVGEPPLITMGPIVEGCTVPARTASFVNGGADAVTVSDVRLDPAAGPFVFTQPATPLTVQPGAVIAVPVGATTPPAGVFLGSITAATQDGVEATVRLSLTVEPAGTPITETFEAADISAVDVLFVVDNSGSMADDQELLAQNFDAFVQTAFSADASVSFHLGATTTDVIGGTGGPLVGPPLSRSTTNLPQAFADQVRVGDQGNGIELGLEAMRRALVNIADADNVVFLRDRAALSVIIISDEEDNGGIAAVADVDPALVRPVETYTEFLHGLKGGALASAPVLVSVVVDPAQSQRYQTVANDFGGVVLDIRDPTWGEQLSRIGAATFGLQRLFRLGTAPDPASVQVRVDGNLVGAFTVSGKDVLLDNEPPRGAVVEITYGAGCG